MGDLIRSLQLVMTSTFVVSGACVCFVHKMQSDPSRVSLPTPLSLLALHKVEHTELTFLLCLLFSQMQR